MSSPTRGSARPPPPWLPQTQQPHFLRLWRYSSSVQWHCLPDPHALRKWEKLILGQDIALISSLPKCSGQNKRSVIAFEGDCDCSCSKLTNGVDPRRLTSNSNAILASCSYLCWGNCLPIWAFYRVEGRTYVKAGGGHTRGAKGIAPGKPV